MLGFGSIVYFISSPKRNNVYTVSRDYLQEHRRIEERLAARYTGALRENFIQ